MRLKVVHIADNLEIPFVVLVIHLRTLFVEWNNKLIFPDSR